MSDQHRWGTRSPHRGQAAVGGFGHGQELTHAGVGHHNGVGRLASHPLILEALFAVVALSWAARAAEVLPIALLPLPHSMQAPVRPTRWSPLRDVCTCATTGASSQGPAYPFPTLHHFF